MSIVLNHFNPVNTWTLDSNGPKFKYEDRRMYLIDSTTKDRYWNESKGTVRHKCFWLTLGTPVIHAVTSVVNVVYRILKTITFAHFWMPKKGKYSFKARLAEMGKDLLRVVATPFAYLGLELSAIYGIFTPYNGRKLYATFERALYNRDVLAPCFQPRPTRHLFGGDPTQGNAW